MNNNKEDLPMDNNKEDHLQVQDNRGRYHLELNNINQENHLKHNNLKQDKGKECNNQKLKDKDRLNMKEKEFNKKDKGNKNQKEKEFNKKDKDRLNKKDKGYLKDKDRQIYKYNKRMKDSNREVMEEELCKLKEEEIIENRNKEDRGIIYEQQGHRQFGRVTQVLRGQQSIDDLSYDQMLELEERMGKVEIVMSEQEIRNLPRVIYQSDGVDAQSCAICQDEFVNGDSAIRLQCAHQFHPNCISKWFRKSRKCPICNQQL
ncbi:MAG: hypothetical protein EZS28_002827 [Streblomastix strix]|uniref:RING-type domain-containing protein n=1 Tax=Streblomastix strix TaxID=222440 RepID=A0A5J4X339_9EUKA|nr:MAG: hypothetical protein EZS28_002827 [Streblomastix strix]